jgi:hypothetical protein
MSLPTEGKLLRIFSKIVGDGLITLERVEVLLYRPGR